MRSTFISMGAGVQTTAIEILLYQGKFHADEIIFSDTGLEKPETYQYIGKYLKPLAREMDIPFSTVHMDIWVDEVDQNNEKTGNKVHCESLRDLIVARRRLPSIWMRWCTDKAKITPIKMYIRSKQEQGEYTKPARAIIGISTDEKHRMHQPHMSEYSNIFPLVESGISRENCKKIIKDFGWELPEKSGCYLCPFQGGREWDNLFYTHNDLFHDAMKLEMRDIKYPTYRLYQRETLEKFGDKRKLGRYNMSIFDDWEGEECSGVCMV